MRKIIPRIKPKFGFKKKEPGQEETQETKPSEPEVNNQEGA